MKETRPGSGHIIRNRRPNASRKHRIKYDGNSMNGDHKSMIQVVKHYISCEPEELTVDKFVTDMTAQWGSHTLAEYLTADMLVIPFYDYDCELPEEPVSLQPHQDNDDAIKEMFHCDDAFCFEKQVLRGWRHGFKMSSKTGKRVYKVSLRYYVRGYSIVMQDIKALIEECSEDRHNVVWDIGIYNSKRKMSAPGSIKDHHDHRVLQVEQPDRLAEYVISNLTGTEKHLQGFDRPETSFTSSRPPPESWDDVKDQLVKAGFISPVYNKFHKSVIRHSRNNKCQNSPGTRT